MNLSTLSTEVILTIILACISGCSFVLGAVWTLSSKNTKSNERLRNIENSIQEIESNIIKEIERRLELLESNFKHEDALIKSMIKESESVTSLKIGRLIAKHEHNKLRISSLVQENKEIKEHLVGLQQGLNRNGIAVRIEEAWLQDALKETILNDSNISGFR